MIVRNEASVLQRCLASAAPHVNEIILVDTGSTDQTREIGEKWGAIGASFTWCDDFSAPRNHSLSLASGDWILVLDADEILTVPDVQELQEQLEKTDQGGFLVPLCNDYGNGKTTRSMILRCFRNHPDIRYRGILHEGVDASLKALCEEHSWKIGEAPFSIQHDGYTESTMNSEEKKSRYFRLFKKSLKEQGNDPFLLYKISVHSVLAGSECENLRKQLLRQAWRLIQEMDPRARNDRPYSSEILAHLALEESRTGAVKESLSLIQSAAGTLPKSPNVAFMRGRLQQRVGAHSEAIGSFSEALGFREQRLLYSAFEGATGYASLSHRSESRMVLGLDDAALADFAHAQSLQKETCNAFFSPQALLIRENDGPRSLRLLAERIRFCPSDRNCRQRAISLATALGEHRVAELLQT